MRVKRGIHRHRRVKTLKAKVKGYRGMKRTTVKKAKEAVIKAGQNAYRDRKLKKRVFRSLWTVRLSAACREHGASYSTVIAALKKAKIVLDRKSLSEIAIHHPEAFVAVLKEAGVGTK
jgi:large subunit ribosomal protein L20